MITKGCRLARSRTRSEGDGVVTAIDNGTATIQAAVDGVLAEVEIVVQQVVDDLVVDPTELVLGMGEEARLTVMPLDANGFLVEGAIVIWCSADDDVATVGGDGLVTGHGWGATHVVAAHEWLETWVPVTVD